MGKLAALSVALSAAGALAIAGGAEGASPRRGSTG